MTQDASGSPGSVRLLANLAVATLALLVSLGLGEIALQALDYSYSPLSIERASPYDERHHHAFEDHDFSFDPELIWAPKKGRGVFNGQGFRGPELSLQKSPGESRIVALGDSNTLGWSGTEGANWPGELQLLTRQLGMRVSVANCGVWGYSSYQGLGRLRECLSLNPDLVLISFGANDAHPVAVPDREYVSHELSDRSWIRQLFRWRLGQLFVATRDRVSTLMRGRELRPRVELEDYRRNLHTMIEIVRRRRAAVALLTRPYVGESRPRSWKSLASDYNAAAGEVAAHEKVPLIDFYSAFRDRRTRFADESHFTREGHRLAALMVLSEIAPLLY